MSSPRAATLVLSFWIGRVSKVSKSHFALCKAVYKNSVRLCAASDFKGQLRSNL